MSPPRIDFERYSNALPQPMAEVRLSYGHHLCVWRTRHARTQTAVRPSTVVMLHPGFQDCAQVRLRYRNQPVKALAAYRADHSLADRIRLRRPRWRFQHAQAQRLDRFIQVLREDAVPVVNQVIGSYPRSQQLLATAVRSISVRVRRDIDPHQSATTMLDHHENIQQSEGRGYRNEEVARQNRFRMILQERCPALVAPRLTCRWLRHVLPHRPRRNPDTQFHQQLAGNSLLTPNRILPGHPADQGS